MCFALDLWSYIDPPPTVMTEDLCLFLSVCAILECSARIVVYGAAIMARAYILCNRLLAADVSLMFFILQTSCV